MNDNNWMTPDEVRKYLGGISLSTLYKYRKMGLHPNYITEKTPRYLRSEVDEWILSRAAKNRKETSND
jgi:predicted DNA-binding transcriptional regulator AlpA